MLKLLTRIPLRRFCLAPEIEKVYDLKFHVKDLTIIKGINSQSPFFKIGQKKFMLPKKKLILSMDENAIDNKNPLQFYDNNMNLYHSTVPLPIVYQDSFYVRYQGDLYYVMNNQPLIKMSQTQQFRQTMTPASLQAVCRESLAQLPDNDQELVSGQALHDLIISNMLKHGLDFKIQKIRLKELQKIVNAKLQIHEEQIRQVMEKLENRSSRMLRYFTNFMLGQYAIVHYFIYFHLSWDIMEPITIILFNFDIFIAYYFFIFRGRSWSLEGLQRSFMERNRAKILRKNGVNVQKYEELLQIKEYIKFKLGLVSKNPHILIETLEKPLMLLDTR